MCCCSRENAPPPDDFTEEEQEKLLEFHVKPSGRHMVFNICLLQPLMWIAFALVTAALWLRYKDAMFASSKTLYSENPHTVIELDHYGVDVSVRNLSFPEYFDAILAARIAPEKLSSTVKTAIRFPSRQEYKIAADTIRESTWRVDEYARAFIASGHWGLVAVALLYTLIYQAIANGKCTSSSSSSSSDPRVKIFSLSLRARECMGMFFICGMIILPFSAAALDAKYQRIDKAFDHAVMAAKGTTLTKAGENIAYSPCIADAGHDDANVTHNAEACVWLVHEFAFDELLDLVNGVYHVRDQADSFHWAYFAIAMTWTWCQALLAVAGTSLAWTALCVSEAKYADALKTRAQKEHSRLLHTALGGAPSSSSSVDGNAQASDDLIIRAIRLLVNGTRSARITAAAAAAAAQPGPPGPNAPEEEGATVVVAEGVTAGQDEEPAC